MTAFTYVCDLSASEKAWLESHLRRLGLRAAENTPTVHIFDIARASASFPGALRIAVGDSSLIAKADALAAYDFWFRPIEGDLTLLRLNRLVEELARRATLEEERQKFEHLIVNIPGVVYRCEFDDGWTMKFISDSVLAVTGYPPEDFLNGTRDYGSIMAIEDRDRVSDEVARALDADEPFSLEYRIKRADGVVRWVNSRGRGIRDSEGELRFLDGAIFDVSAEKEVEQELEEHRQELARSNEELQRVDRLRTRMFQNVSHELRTPLALIVGPVHRLHTKAKSEEKSVLSSVLRNSYRLLDQINALLDVAKMETQGLPVRCSAVDVGAFLQRLCEDVRPAANDRQIDLVFTDRREQRATHYSLDAQHLERIVLNLLSNALKLTPPDGRVDVTLDDDQELVIAVADTGPGIAPEAQQRIFQRFAQADEHASTTVGGTGIGLSLVWELTRQMGGRVALDSRIGEGARFELRFPSSLQTSETQETSQTASRLESVLPTTGMAGMSRRARYEALRQERASGIERSRGSHGPNVLVVEDNIDLNREISTVLGEKFRVTCAFDGNEALDLLVDMRPAAIVSDINMPGMDGLELCRRLRERADYRDVGIVLLSALADVDARVRGRKVGVDAYLTKPFHPDELLATVEGLLRSRLRLVGEYEVHHSLGEGGQGSVFLAQSSAGEFVALKLISGGSVREDRARRQLKAEMDLLLRVEHPNVVRVINNGANADVAFVAMEFLDGANFEQVLAHAGELSDAEAATLLIGALRGVVAIHEHGILHRDLKCGNLMLLRSGPRDSRAVKVVDFGIAYEKGAETKSGVVSGTLPYMAPELSGLAAATAMTEAYALGVVAYRLLTSEYPKWDLSPTALGPLSGRLQLADLANVAERLSDSVHQGWIVSALAQDPAARPTCEEILARLLELALPPALPSMPDPAVGAADLAATR